MWGMNKKIIIWSAVGILAIAGIVAFSYPSQNAEKKEQAAALGLITNLVAPETNYDFGSISMAAGEVGHIFGIRNDSTTTMALGELSTSCMCTNAYFVKDGDKLGPFGMPGHGFVPKLGQELKPGESAEIEVVFDPAAHGPAGIGPVERAVFLGSGGNVKQFGIKAIVTP
jgi:hypothetical protein